MVEKNVFLIALLHSVPVIVPDSGQPTNITHLVKKRKKSESDVDAGSAAENGDVAKKPHVEANGNSHTNGN